MGFNTAVLILNDAAHELTTDLHLGRKMSEAMGLSQRAEYRERGVDFSIGHHANGGLVLPSHHADQVQIIAVGGNYMRPLTTLWGAWRNMQEPEKLLREMADQMGFRLVRKAAR